MDTTRSLTEITRNERGVTLVYIALVLIVLLGFIGLAADMGYMYVAKGQLQNAADAAALAGAAKLPDPTETRTEAVAFAHNNKAAGSNIDISSDNSNTLSSDNDITLGHWDSATTTYTPGGAPVNAVEVRARRTSAEDPAGKSIGGRVKLFFTKVLGRSDMGASAAAIASRLPAAGFYFTLGKKVCDTTSFPVVLSPSPGTDNMAWTSLLKQPTSASGVKDDYICPANMVPNIEVCGHSIYTTNGVGNTTFQAAETDFYDPEYDASNKTFNADRTVATWTVIVPVPTVDDPSLQPSPMPIWGYARVRIIRACGAGVGAPCSSSSGRLFTAPTGVCSGGENDIVIDQIECVSCEDSSSMIGIKPGLVQ